MTDELKLDVAVLKERIGSLEGQVKRIEDSCETLTDLRVELGKLQMQIKVTWILLMMVISSLVGVAFSVWRM